MNHKIDKQDVLVIKGHDVMDKCKTARQHTEKKAMNANYKAKAKNAITVLAMSLVGFMPAQSALADDTDVFFTIGEETNAPKTNIMFILDEATSMTAAGQFVFDPTKCGEDLTDTEGKPFQSPNPADCYDPKHVYTTSDLDDKEKKSHFSQDEQNGDPCYHPDEWYFIPKNSIAAVSSDKLLGKCFDSVTSSAALRRDRPLLMNSLSGSSYSDEDRYFIETKKRDKERPLLIACDGLAEDIAKTGGRVDNFFGLYDQRLKYPKYGWAGLDKHLAGGGRGAPFIAGGLADQGMLVAIECLSDIDVNNKSQSHGKDDNSSKKYITKNFDTFMCKKKWGRGYFSRCIDVDSAWTEDYKQENMPSLDDTFGGIYSGNYLNYLRYATKKSKSLRREIFKKAIKRYIERSKGLRLGLASFKQAKHWGGRGKYKGLGGNCSSLPLFSSCAQRGNSDGGNIDVPIQDIDQTHPKFQWAVDYDPLHRPLYGGNPNTPAQLLYRTIRNHPIPNGELWFQERDIKHREWLWAKVDEYFTDRVYDDYATGTQFADVPSIGKFYTPRLEIGGKKPGVIGLKGSSASYVPYRPLGETLFEVGRYFKGEKVVFGAYSRPEAWMPHSEWPREAGFPHMKDKYWNPQWGWDGDQYSSTEQNGEHIIKPERSKNYVSPIEEDCQASAAVIFTDYAGERSQNAAIQSGVFNEELNQTKVNGILPPYNDFDEAPYMQELWPGLDCTTYIKKYGTCLPGVAEYLNTKDLNTTIPGKQNVKTFIVNYWNDNYFKNGQEPKGVAMLREAARLGGGKYIRFGADLAELDEAIGGILNLTGMNPVGSGTFVAPTASVDLSSRLQNDSDLYYSLFEPSDKDRWRGNLKRYKIRYNNNKLEIVNDECNEATGVNCNLAITADAKFTDNAKSAWTAQIDAGDIKKGGAQDKQVIPRQVYTDYGLANDSKLALINKTLSFTDSSVWDRQKIESLGVDFAMDSVDINVGADKALKTFVKRRVDFAQGYEVDGVQENGANKVFRRIGDPLHSQPKLVLFKSPLKDSTGNLSFDKNSAIVFFGTNEGYLHAVDVKTGEEVFSFLPRKAYGALGQYYNNLISKESNGKIRKVYGLDAEIEVWVNDLNGDGDVYDSTGTVVDKDAAGNEEGVYLFFGMRRGGTAYYALDVTKLNEPKLKWKIERQEIPANLTGPENDANTKFYELGQTWAKPQVIRGKFEGKQRAMLVVAGGYDDEQDYIAKRGVSSKGRALYVLDAATGKRLWAVGFKGDGKNDKDFNAFDITRSDMKYSFAATPAVIDTDGDKLIDTIIATDTGGQIWRVDLNKDNTGASNFATVDLIATLAGEEDSTDTDRPHKNNRKFFNTPDLMVDSTGGKRSLVIAVGSGNRTDPISAGVDNHFYVLRSSPAIGPKKNADGNVTAREALELSDLLDATSNSAYEGARASNSLGNFNKNGFYIKLGQKEDANGLYRGEKVVSDATIFNGYVVFTSYIPSKTPEYCGAALGKNRFNAVNIKNPDANRLVREMKQNGIAPKPSVLILNDGTKRRPALVSGTEVIQPAGLPKPLQDLYSLSRDKVIRFWTHDKTGE